MFASPEQAAEHWAAFVGKQLAQRDATHAGDRALQGKRRVFGVVHYDDDGGHVPRQRRAASSTACRRTR